MGKIKPTKFKFPTGNDLARAICNSGWFASGTKEAYNYMFQVAWLKTLETKAGVKLCALAQARQIEVVKARLLGAGVAKELGAKIAQYQEAGADMSYVPFNIAEAKTRLGYAKLGKDRLKERPIGFELENQYRKELVGVAIHFAAALALDPTATVKIAGQRDPILIFKGADLVGIVMPCIFNNQTEGN